jgi:hypothetical protein
MALAMFAAVGATVGATAHADSDTDKAKAAVEASDYMAARTALEAALATGANGPEQLAEIYRLSGVVAGALGDAKKSTEAFERCLALAPKTTLPAGTSPKIVKPFTAAQKSAKEPLKIKADTSSSPPSVTIVVASDPLSMIARVRVLVVVDKKPEQKIEKPASERTTIALPAGKRLDLRIAALDDKGNRLAEVGTTDVPLVIVGPGGDKDPDLVAKKPPTGEPLKPPPPPPSPRPFVLRWYTWAGASVVFLGAGAYFGYSALQAKHDLDDLNATSPNHTFDQAQAVEQRARNRVLFTNIALATGGVFAIGAGILYLTTPKATERRVAVTPVPGGAAVVMGGQF